MSNHFHVVLHVDRNKAGSLSSLEVCQRWHQVFKGSSLTHRFCQGEALTDAEYDVVNDIVEKWRNQLFSISWFMRCLNEPIARHANREDDCTGSFWESRFSCQALLDEKALAACMAYVDLNLVRAKIAQTPETSNFTSIKRRIQCLKKTHQPDALFPFIGNPREPMPTGLPFNLNDYLELVDWTGRILRSDKRGAIDAQLPSILQRLNLDPLKWTQLTRAFEQKTGFLVGSPSTITYHAPLFGYQRRRIKMSASLFL